MHVLFRESHGLEETDTPTDLGQAPADLVVLSFSDSDLGAFAAGWHRARAAGAPLPALRLANLALLRHPLSVDTYVEQTLSGAQGILIRLIGGVPYWAYGLQQVQALARARGIALAVLPGDGQPDARLDAASTLPVSTLRRLQHLCETGGPVAAQAALQQLALASGLYAPPVRGARALASVGGWQRGQGVTCPAGFALQSVRPRVALVFYRAYLAAADMAPLAALGEALTARGFDVLGLFAPSLKEPDARGWMARWLQHLQPVAVINATAFSARSDAGESPLDAPGVPVFQVALATNERSAWAEAPRGLSPADLAMHVVLPEVDGRLFAGVASFKQPAPRDLDLQFARVEHCPEPARITAIAERVAGWVRLGRTPAAERDLAMVLSSYPGKGWQMAHAVGLDALQSVQAMLGDLVDAGYSATPVDGLSERLAGETLSWPLGEYRAALARLPQALRDDLAQVRGAPEDDPAFRDGAFHFPALRAGRVLVALQPERGDPRERDDEYHDTARCPRHGYVAFYLWLRAQGLHALVHIGAHGTLEWLPGKSVALSDSCWPEALVGDLPVIYPFIVNDPGEAAQAKRRIGLGVTGLADALIALGVRYGSPEAERLAESWMAAIERAAYLASAELAAEKGAFPLYDAERFLAAPNVTRLPQEVQEAIRRHGIRNGCLTSIAPTGTISLYAGNVSSGIEPVFAYAYNRKVLQKDGSRTTEEVVDYAVKLWRDKFGDTPFPDYFVSAQTLSPADHVRMQAAAQTWVDSAISKTINCPEDISFEDFQDVYLQAWEQGCKGCTTYRPNAVTGSVLSVSEPEKKAEEAPKAEAAPAPAPAILERGDMLTGSTYRMKWPGDENSYYVTINDTIVDGQRVPFEIFVNTKNLESQAWISALTLMISAVMRRERDVAFIAQQLMSVVDARGGAFMPGQGYVNSRVAAIGRVIAGHFIACGIPVPGFQAFKGKRADDVAEPEVTEMPVLPKLRQREGCPDYGNCNMINEAGCDKCLSCGFSKCS